MSELALCLHVFFFCLFLFSSIYFIFRNNIQKYVFHHISSAQHPGLFHSNFSVNNWGSRRYNYRILLIPARKPIIRFRFRWSPDQNATLSWKFVTGQFNSESFINQLLYRMFFFSRTTIGVLVMKGFL